MRSSQKSDELIKGIKRKLSKENVPEKTINQFIEEINKNNIKTRYEIIKTAGVGLEVGGDGFRAIAKIAVNFYIYKGGDIASIEHLIPYIKNGDEIGCVRLYGLSKEIVVKQGNNDILHSVIVIGNKKEKLLYSYVELFSFYSCIVLLNSNYEGDDFSESHFLYFDISSDVRKPIKPDEVKREFNVNMSKSEIDEIFSMDEEKFPVVCKNKMRMIFDLAQERTHRRGVRLNTKGMTL